MAMAMAFRYAFLMMAGWLLTPNEYGLLGVSLAVLAIGGLLLGGFPWAATKFTSEDRGSFAFRTVLLANLGLAIVFGCLLYVGYSLGLLGHEGKYGFVLIFLIVLGLLAAVGGIYDGILRGLFRFKELGIIRALDQLVTLGGVGFILLGWGLGGALLGVILGFVVATVLGWYFTRDRDFLRGGRWWEREVQSFGWPMIVGGASAYLLMNLDIIGLKIWGGADGDILAGQYQVALVLARMPLVMVLGTVLETLFPFVARYSTDKEKVEAYIDRIVRYALVFCIPIALALAILPGKLLGLLFPQTYQAAASALSVLSVGYLVLTFNFVFSKTLQAAVGPTSPALVFLVAAVVQLGLLYALVPRYGLWGAAASTALAATIALAGLVWLHGRRYRIRLPVRSMVAIAVSSGLMAVILLLVPSPNVLALIGTLALGSLTFLVALMVLRGVDKEDANLLLSGLLPDGSRLKAGAIRVVGALNKVSAVSHV